MATCLNEVTTNMLKNLTIGDVMCPICRGIFIEPVLMPCRHALCLQCFKRTMEENSLTCPLCRKRIGGWLRTAKTKHNNLVHNELWAYIQKRFPAQVHAKLKGEDDGVEEHVVGRVSACISSPGEIRKEFELHVKQLEEETRKKLEAERRASEDLIRKIQEEEEKQYLATKQQLLLQQEVDEQLAKELQEHSMQSTSGTVSKKESVGGNTAMDNKENKNRAPGSMTTQIKGPLDSYLLSQQKKFASSSGKLLTTSENFNINLQSSKHKSVSELEKFRSQSNISTGSHDSINQEMHHFKPIKSVPRTPPKKITDPRVHVPMVVKATPMNLNPLYDNLSGSSGSTPYVSSSFRQQLLKVQQDRSRNLRGVLRISEVYPPISAFRGKAFLQKSEPLKNRSDVEQCTEMESPRKKARQDSSTEERRPSFATSELGSYSSEDCDGKKVIAIVHHQEDELVDVEGKIGGHDRRFGGSEEEENCGFNLANKDDNESESESGDIDYEDADVSRIIGVEPEFDSQQSLETRYKNKTSSSRVNLKLDKLRISPAESHAKRNNITKKITINNNDIKGVSNNQSKSQNVATKVSPERCKNDLDEILPFCDEDPTLLLSDEQARIENMIKQEREDLQLALRLQREWEMADSVIDRSKGSMRAYELRNSNKSKSNKKVASKKNGRGRQSTLEESFTGTTRTSRRQ